jgi:predicted metal-dependent peptidase
MSDSVNSTGVTEPALSNQDLAKAARFTLISLNEHRSVGQLALRYAHVVDINTKHIAYATGKKCVYGPRFGEMDRFSQAFVVFHEVFHHVLAHIEHGALLYKREGSKFNPIAFNIACDAIINFVAETLPDVDKLGSNIRYGVRKCQEFGIVNWSNLVAEVNELAARTGLRIDPVFSRMPNELSSVEIYHALMRTARQAAAPNQGLSEPGSDGSSDPSTSDTDDEMQRESASSIIDRIAKSLGAHDDLSDAIKETSVKGEGEILDQISRSDEILRRAQSGASAGDAILRIARPDSTTSTPWPRAMRRMASTALLHRPSVDPLRPSRRVISQVALARDPRTPTHLRPNAIMFEPRTSSKIPAKRCVTILDTSGSMFCDKQLLTDCIREIATICKRVASSQVIIFADADVCEVVEIEDSARKIADLKPKGGGGTDFRPAIALAESFNPDLIVYITDLAGTFPQKKPRMPIIWAFPPSYAKTATPFGQRLPLSP